MRLETIETVEARRASAEVGVAEFAHAEWERARPVHLTRYWSGASAPPERRAEARIIWTDEALSVRFICRQSEPLVVNPEPQLERKTIGLWERDVCEIFIAPDASDPERYFEFEAAPTGEWLDLALRLTGDERHTDWDFRSGMSAAARIDPGSVAIAIRVPFSPLIPASSERAPRAGDIWRVNLYRCVGSGEARGYLAWQPTETPEPGFHAPHKFGLLRFGME
ncbi:MAG TPA: carbohydrate-binding family 9-like protein [Pyrinomonadaceae bacterium]